MCLDHLKRVCRDRYGPVSPAMRTSDCLSASSGGSSGVSRTNRGATEEEGVQPHPFLQRALSLGHLPQPPQEEEEARGRQLSQQRPGELPRRAARPLTPDSGGEPERMILN